MDCRTCREEHAAGLTLGALADGEDDEDPCEEAVQAPHDRATTVTTADTNRRMRRPDENFTHHFAAGLHPGAAQRTLGNRSSLTNPSKARRNTPTD
jgi:hypothetical protein